jgi:hypothetical protein
MTPYFDNPEAVARLDAAAARWIGTPFVSNSCSVGHGVCCHLLAAAVLEEAGAIPARQYPTGSARGAWNARSAIMEQWVDENMTPALRRCAPDTVMPGDLIGYRVGAFVHHLGVALSGARVLHAVRPEAGILSLSDATWGGRIAVVWRAHR